MSRIMSHQYPLLQGWYYCRIGIHLCHVATNTCHMSHVTFTIKLYCGIWYLSLYMVQAEVDEKAGRQGRGRGAKQASLHTLMQVSLRP